MFEVKRDCSKNKMWALLFVFALPLGFSEVVYACRLGDFLAVYQWRRITEDEICSALPSLDQVEQFVEKRINVYKLIEERYIKATPQL